MIKETQLLETEACFIGFLLKDPKAVNNVSITKDYLKDFEGYNFQYIFSKILELSKNNQDNILESLLTDEHIKEGFLLKICGSNPYDSMASFQELENIIIQAHKEDQIQKEYKRFKNGELNTNEYTERIEQINELGTVKNVYLNASDLRKCLEQDNTSIKCLGFPTLESLLKLKEHDFIVIGASTGSGKTALTLNLISELSKHYPCLYFNMEMSEDDIGKRLIAIESGVRLDIIENHKHIKNADTKKKIDEAIERIIKKKLIIKTGALNINAIKGIINRLDPNTHTLVFIDHIGMIRSKGNSLYEKTTELAKTLRAMALNNNITIFALSQLSRGQTQQGNKAQYNEPPTLNRLKESGEIENSARQVLFIWQRKTDDYYIRIAKNTRGNTGIDVPITFTKNTMTIKER